MIGGRAAGIGCLVVSGVLAICGFATLVFVAALGGIIPQQMGMGGSCKVLTSGGHAATNLAPAQRRNAKIIVEVGKSMGIPAQGWVVAIATAYQESTLKNVDYGDRDSVGLFQQRPSMGWGTVEQITNPRYAARQFYSHLRQIQGWQEMPLTEAAQAVQRSAFPDAYADHAAMARAVVSNLAEGGFSCPDPVMQVSGRGPDGEWLPEEMGPEGLTPRTRHVMELIKKRFSEDNIGGYCPGGCTSGHVEGSDHYDGHAIDVMILPYTDPARVNKGWRITNWLVANHQKLAIKYVIYRDRIWTGDEGWHPYTHPSGSTSDPTLRHLDHIHVSVY